LRFDKEILTKEDIIQALRDWGTIATMYEANEYIKLYEKIKKILPLHLSNEILKNEEWTQDLNEQKEK
jgi:hypothetical protein